MTFPVGLLLVILSFPINLHSFSFLSDAVLCLFSFQSQGQLIRAAFPTCSPFHMPFLFRCFSTEQRTGPGGWLLEFLALTSNLLCQDSGCMRGLVGRSPRNARDSCSSSSFSEPSGHQIPHCIQRCWSSHRLGHERTCEGHLPC